MKHRRVPAMTRRVRPYEEWTREEWIARLELLGPILWEPGREGVAGWAICPCCGERELWVEFPVEAGHAS